MGDGELAAALVEFARGADDVKKSFDADLKKDPAVDKATRESTTEQFDQLAKDAKALSNLVKDGKPSSGEAGALISSATRMRSVLDRRPLPESVSIWSEMMPRLQIVATAYGISWPSALSAR